MRFVRRRCAGGRESALVRRVPRRLGEASLKQLKGSLFRRLMAGTQNPVLRAALQRAATDAESLAWLSPYPLLVLPVLLEEKARESATPPGATS